MSGNRWSASVAALFLLTTVPASAAPGLDLLVIIDRSASMAHRSRHQDVLLHMTADLLARDGLANRAMHRLAVIGFGSAASVELPFTSISGDDDELRRRLSTLRYVDRGETDVLAAFVLGEKLFREIPAGPERRRAIILLTDGFPFVRGVDAIAYRQELRRFVTDHLARNGITIDALVLDGRNKALWSAFARVSAAGGAPDELLPQAHAVVAHLTGTLTSESVPAKSGTAESLILPPYLEVVVFDVFRAARDASVQIFPPGAETPIRTGANGTLSRSVGDVLATVVVPHPPPGEWTIRKSRPDARVRILSEQFFPRGTLLRPRETETLLRCTRVPLAYALLDGHGEPLRELPDHALALQLRLAGPNGSPATVAMKRDPVLGATGFRSTEDPLCNVAGRYWTDVRVTTLDAKGHRREIFRDRWSGFSVLPSDCTPSPIHKKTTP